MGVYLGGYDPIKLIESILNALVAKGVLTADEAKKIVEEARAPTSAVKAR